MYGETGWEIGGRFKPHKTHQNGLSVDFMVPVTDDTGKSVPLPTGPFNKYGYGTEFDSQGRFENLSIDFDAMAAHIRSMHVEAGKAGIDIWRLIFDPVLQPLLYKAKDGKYVRQHVFIPKNGRGCVMMSIRDPGKTHHPMKVRRGVQKLSGAVFCIPHRRDNAFFPSSLPCGFQGEMPTDPVRMRLQRSAELTV